MSAFEKREEAFALSPQQRSQWLAGLPAVRLELEIKGPLALERLHQRLVALSACHEALRLRVRPEPGLLTPLQVVESTVTAADAIGVEVQSISDDRHRVTLQLPALSADRGTLLRLAQALASTDAPSLDDEAMTYTQYSACSTNCRPMKTPSMAGASGPARPSMSRLPANCSTARYAATAPTPR